MKPKVSITKRVGYVAENDVKKGVCGYDSCKKKLPTSSKEVPKPIECDDHEQTRQTAFRYLTDEQCQKQYNAELEFSQALDHVHACIHKDV